MKAQHTPGPWIARLIGDGHTINGQSADVIIEDKNNIQVCKIHPHDIVFRHPSTGITGVLKSPGPNARLIAAAPDLLAAVREILTAHDYALTHGGDIITSSAWANLERVERLATEPKP